MLAGGDVGQVTRKIHHSGFLQRFAKRLAVPKFRALDTNNVK